MRRWIIIIGIVVLVAAAILIFCDYLLIHDNDGAYPLKVSLVSKSSRGIKGASMFLFATEKEAAYAIAEPNDFDPVLGSASWEDGSSFTVPVYFGGWQSGLGRDLDYGQAHFLALCVEYADGNSEYVTAEIPDGRRQREITVEVP